MASALAYTSALGLAHHDLKLDNFLLHQVLVLGNSLMIADSMSWRGRRLAA
jgi:hypothetical protein